MKGAEGATAEPAWPETIYKTLKAGNIKQVAYVPDGGHKRLISLFAQDPEVASISLTTEEEGIALAAGAYLGGQLGVLLVQSSGVGNCINMLSLMRNCQFPLLMLVTMRGDFGEGNPWQIPMGQAVRPTLEAMGVICLRIETEEDVGPVVAAASRMAFSAMQAVAVLISQRLIGAKQFK